MFLQNIFTRERHSFSPDTLSFNPCDHSAKTPLMATTSNMSYLLAVYPHSVHYIKQGLCTTVQLRQTLTNFSVAIQAVLYVLGAITDIHSSNSQSVTLASSQARVSFGEKGVNDSNSLIHKYC